MLRYYCKEKGGWSKGNCKPLQSIIEKYRGEILP